MRQADSDRKRWKELSRRRYAQALAGASVAGLAGCMGIFGDDDGNEGDGGDGGDGGGGDSDGGDGDGNSEPSEHSTLRLVANNVPEQSNFNEWSSSTQAEGLGFLTELSAPRNADTWEKTLSGETYDASWIDGVDEISVPSMIADYEIDPPYDAYETHDDRLTYWDGTDLDAEARLFNDHVQWFWDGYKFDETETFNSEVVSKWEYHQWRDKGEVDGQEDQPTNANVIESDLQIAETDIVPLHPEFTEQWRQQYIDAGTEDEIDSVSEELGGENITFYDLAANDWGSGLYRVESEDDVSAESLTATKRDDHPNEHANIEEIQLQFASPDRQNVLAERGNTDLAGGIVQQEGGDINRGMLPDHVQEIDRYLSDGGDQLLFNWNNEHLENLWVRRAIVAAVDWYDVGANGWGAERSVPVEDHTGLHGSVSRGELDDDFRDSLYRYPLEQDLELAEEWLERAGYQRDGDGWVSPDGTTLELTIKANTDIPEYVPAGRTIQSHLQQLGMAISFQGINFDTFTNDLAPENNNFDLMIYWAGGSDPWEYYWTDGQWWAMPLLNGDPNQQPMFEIPEEDYSEYDTMGIPLDVEIPSQPGDIEAAPDEAGRAPDLSDGEEISLPQIVHGFRKPDLSDEEYRQGVQQCATFYNFYLPRFRFHDYTWGVWGNVRDFDFPEEGHRANRMMKGFSGDDFLSLSGVAQNSEDADFEQP